MRISISLYNTMYICISYRLWDIQRQIMAWSWSRSFKVIESGTIRKLRYGFLFAFHNNYGSILYHFRDKARYWWKIAIFFASTTFDAPVRGSRWNIARTFDVENTRLMDTRLMWPHDCEKGWGLQTPVAHLYWGWKSLFTNTMVDDKKGKEQKQKQP